MGIEPTSEAWEASILPLNYARISDGFILALCRRMMQKLFFLQIKTGVDGGGDFTSSQRNFMSDKPGIGIKPYGLWVELD